MILFDHVIFVFINKAKIYLLGLPCIKLTTPKDDVKSVLPIFSANSNIQMNRDGPLEF